MVILYYGQFEHYGYCENWIADALDRGGHHCLRIRRTPWFDESRVITIARQNNATHLLLSKCPEITADQLQTLKTAGLVIVFWTFDWMRHPDNWSWYGPLAKTSDICFQTDGYAEAELYIKEGINRVELHQGAVPGLHEIPSTRGSAKFLAASASDVVFIGSEYTDRRHALVRRLTRLDGPNSLFAKWGEPGEQLWGHAFAAATYLSKIVVGDNFTNEIDGYWSDRVYLTLGCGGFFLTAYVPGLERKFANHEHLVWWKTFEELEELIEYYLPREAERKAIALCGHRLVHERHTYDDRVAVFTDYLESLGVK